MAEYRIKNWKQYQHYKHRSPPWIKLHKTLLDDPDFFELGGDDSKVLIMLWLVASEHHGELPRIKRLAFQLRRSEREISSALSRLSHWIERDASSTLAVCLHGADSETETETETEKKESTALFLKSADAKKRTTDRGSRLDESWIPKDVTIAGAISILGQQTDWRDVATEFRDYWTALPGIKARKLDWEKTFLNRCRAIATRKPNGKHEAQPRQYREYRPPGWTAEDEKKLAAGEYRPNGAANADRPKNTEGSTAQAESVLDAGARVRH